MTILIDDFNGTNGQLLSARPPGWEVFKQFANNFPTIVSNAASFLNNESSHCGVSLNYSGVNQDIEITLASATQTSLSDNGGIFLRLSYTLNAGVLVASSLNGIVIRHFGTNSINIYDVVNNSISNFAALTLATETWAVGDRLRAKITGSTVSIFRNSVLVGTVTGRTHNATGMRFGIIYPLTSGVTFNIDEVNNPDDTFGGVAAAVLTPRPVGSGEGLHILATDTYGGPSGKPCASGTSTVPNLQLEMAIFSTSATSAAADVPTTAWAAATTEWYDASGSRTATANTRTLYHARAPFQATVAQGQFKLGIRQSGQAATAVFAALNCLMGDVLQGDGQSNIRKYSNSTGLTAGGGSANIELFIQDSTNLTGTGFSFSGWGINGLATELAPQYTARRARIFLTAQNASAISQHIPGGSLESGKIK
jgi:hypothetical protein